METQAYLIIKVGGLRRNIFCNTSQKTLFTMNVQRLVVSFRILAGSQFTTDVSNEENIIKRLLAEMWAGLRKQMRGSERPRE